MTASRTISKVLIANRGEIALRVARTCRELGLGVVVACSSSDRDSAAAAYADEAVVIGPPAPRRSYLNPAALVQAALQTGADAVHPGYGFLSEDADFAEICAANDLIFIGPDPDVMRRLGDKAEARRVAEEAGLPVLPGSVAATDNVEQARARAAEIGHPVLIKAAAGGGGLGMTLVRDPDDFAREFAAARASAEAAFGDGRMYVEKFLEDARHVEVQVLADRHGGVVHLGVRDCSVQRRRQKLIEETPPPGISAELAERIGAAAAGAARYAGYTGAGTYEFLLDSAGNFTFMEVNCRIQVEHPITEMVSGVDVVREQILVAMGEPLSLRQADVALRGVSVECRVNAEDPARGFVPSPGVVRELEVPGGPFTRVDTHCRVGMAVAPHYDSLLAKAVVWAPDRAQALARMDRVLAEFRVTGPGLTTTIPFLREVLAHPLFVDGKHTTTLVDQMLDQPS
jgi:acetyl-CoA carboxylase biotin carboxylase subunit